MARQVRALDGTYKVKGKEWILRLFSGLHMCAMGRMHVITHNV